MRNSLTIERPQIHGWALRERIIRLGHDRIHHPNIAPRSLRIRQTYASRRKPGCRAGSDDKPAIKQQVDVRPITRGREILRRDRTSMEVSSALNLQIN
jgi:hypothetical protein